MATTDRSPDAAATDPRVRTARSEDLDAVLALADRARDADGHPPLNDQTRAVLSRGAQRWWSVAEDPETGDLVGVAVLAPEAAEDGDGVVELVVAPDSRRAGIGGALAAAAADAVRADGRPASAWAHGDLPGSAELARRHGLAPARELRRMRLDAPALGRPPAVPTAEGVRLRAFSPGRDEEAWLRVNAEAFAAHPEQGALTREDLEERMAQPWFRADGLLLAEDAQTSELLGFHWTKVEETAGGGLEGEVYVVGVSPAAQGRGLGRLLTLAGLRHMADRGVAGVDLYVDADNTAAVRLYESLGFALAAADVQHRPVA